MLRFLIVILIAGFLFMLTGCSFFFNKPMHEPIYPSSNQAVTYTFEVLSANPIKEIKLFETASKIDAKANKTPGKRLLKKSWKMSGKTTSETVKYINTSGYAKNQLITYEFEVLDNQGYSGLSKVDFAIRPYPVPGHAAPIYVQGDPNRLLDFVFIRDDRLKTAAQQQAFRQSCKKMITDAIINIDSLSSSGKEIHLFSSAYNFYINPDPGHASSYNPPSLNPPHTQPKNWKNISFAEVKAILHNEKLIDWSMYGSGPFSSHMNNPGTMRHESGHKAFNLADEYCCNGGYYSVPPYPNLWNSEAKAKAAAPDRGKSTSDVRQLKSGSNKVKWWKICADSCQMNNGFILRSFDDPDLDRIRYVIIDTLTK